jgi:hypothetical protein
LDGPLPKWCPAVALSRQDGRHSAVALLLKAALIQVSDYRLLGGILFYFCPSVLPSVQDIFHRIFLSNCWWQKSNIWSQASYRCTILWVAFLYPSDSYFLFADLVGFYSHWTYTNAHFSSHFSQQLLMAEIWYLVPHIVGSVFGPVRILLPVCRRARVS